MSLFEAIEQEDEDMLHVLLDSGSDVNKREDTKVLLTQHASSIESLAQCRIVFDTQCSPLIRTCLICHAM
jgi:hypothetical protein